MTRSTLQRSLAAMIGVASGLLWLTSTISPAGAVQKPVVSLDPGETIVNKYPALIGPNYQQGRRPSSCSSSTRISCDTIPIELNVSQAELDAHPSDFLLIVETDWNVRASETVPAVGTLSDDQINTYVYKNPPRETVEVDPDTGEETRTQVEENSAFLNPPPTSLSFAQVETTSYLITVENMVGYNDGYTLTVSFLYLGGDRPIDGSIDEDIPFDFSDTDQFAETTSFNDLSPTTYDTFSDSALNFSDLAGGAAGSFGFPATRAVSLDLAELQADTDLDDLAGVDNAAVLKLQKAQEIGNIANVGPPPIRDASSIALLLWLLIVPLLVAAAAMFFAFRRRAILAGIS